MVTIVFVILAGWLACGLLSTRLFQFGGRLKYWDRFNRNEYVWIWLVVCFGLVSLLIVIGSLIGHYIKSVDKSSFTLPGRIKREFFNLLDLDI